MSAKEVADIKSLRRALSKFDPTLYKAMNKEIRGLLRNVQKDARSLIPHEIAGLRTGWTDRGITTKSFKSYRPFPKYNYALAKQGIVISTGAQKKNRNGFVSYYSIINKSAPGKILETAGRRNPDGRAPVMELWSKNWGGTPGGAGAVGTTYKRGKGIIADTSHGYRSNNPFAGYQFVHAIDRVAPMGSVGRGMKNKGRIIYRAVENDQGKTKTAILRVIEETRKSFYAQIGKAA